MIRTSSAKKIIGYEIAGFVSILVISWANEIFGFSQRILGAKYAMNWQDAATETLIAVVVAIPTIIMSWRLTERLHYLEGFLRVCAWCRKVGEGDEWISIEQFVEKNLNTQTSHGICPDCARKLKSEKFS